MTRRPSNGPTDQRRCSAPGLRACGATPGRSWRQGGRMGSVCTSGPTTSQPRNPSTTDGIPASISIRGLRISRTQPGAISRMNTAVARPRGTERATAPIVTQTDPKSRGRMPYSSSMGYHRVLRRLSRGTSTSAGTPSLNRNSTMRSTRKMAETPVRRTKVSTTNSPHPAPVSGDPATEDG